MVFAIVGLATVVGDFGLSMAAIQAKTLSAAQRSNLFWTNTALGVVLFLVIFASAPLISLFYDEPDLTPITQVLGLAFVLNAVSAQFRAEVSRKLRFKQLALIDVLAAVLALAGAVGAALAGLGFWALVAQQLSLALVTLLGLILAARWWPGRPDFKTDMRSLYAYGGNTLGVQVFVYLTSSVDSILIGKFWGASALGMYDRAFTIFRLPLRQIAAPMTKVGVPILSRLQDDTRYSEYVYRAQLVLGYCFGGTFFVLAAVSDPFIDLMLGSGWGEVKPIFLALALGGVFQGMTFVYSWVFLSLALTGLQLKWTIIGRTAMVAAICIGLPAGPLGVAIGATVGQAINWLLLTVFPISKTGLRRSSLVAIAVRPVLVYTPITMLSLALSHSALEPLEPLPKLLALGGVFLVCLAATLLFPAVRRDARALLDTVKRLRR